MFKAQHDSVERLAGDVALKILVGISREAKEILSNVRLTYIGDEADETEEILPSFQNMSQF